MDLIPPEILLRIFYSLDSSDILAARLVCNTWCHLLNDKQLFIARVRPTIPEDHIWNKYYTVMPENFAENHRTLEIWVRPEQHFNAINLQILEQTRNTHPLCFNIISRLTSTLVLPDIIPKEFEVLMKAMINILPGNIFWAWLDLFIELYDIPYSLEPIACEPENNRLDHLIYQGLRQKEPYGTPIYRSAAVYWNCLTHIFTNHLTAIKTPEGQAFICKYYGEINWKMPKAGKVLLSETFLMSSVGLPIWNWFNWYEIIQGIKFSASSLEKILEMPEMHKYIRSIAVTQTISNELYNKYITLFQSIDEMAKERLFMNNPDLQHI